MYPNNDTLVRVRLATCRARELESLIRSQIDRSRALTGRAAAPWRSGSAEALRSAVDEALRASELLAAEACEHLRRSRDLLSRGVE